MILPSTDKRTLKKGNSANARPVLCVETGIIYSSLTEAAERADISKPSICNCCRGKLPMAGGYRWRYVEEGMEANGERYRRNYILAFFDKHCENGRLVCEYCPAHSVCDGFNKMEDQMKKMNTNQIYKLYSRISKYENILGMEPIKITEEEEVAI